MSEVNLVANLEMMELVAFKLVKTIIFFCGLWHLLNLHLHLTQHMRVLGSSFGRSVRLFGRLVNYLDAEEKKSLKGRDVK